MSEGGPVYRHKAPCCESPHRLAILAQAKLGVGEPERCCRVKQCSTAFGQNSVETSRVMS
jgi:hypothetical protein